MTKVYLVTTGEYSDYYVEAVWDDPKLAEAHRALLKGANPVETRELNRLADKLCQGLRIWRVRMTKDGDKTHLSCLGVDNEYELLQTSSGWIGYCDRYDQEAECYVYTHEHIGTFTCWAKSEEQAIEIVNELRTQIIAEDNWQAGYHWRGKEGS